jgi:RNA polymerase sigma-70 factor (ECF subfamily)
MSSTITDEAVPAPTEAVLLVTPTESPDRFARVTPPASRDARPTADAPSDAVLMQRASNGDPGAFALIYDRHACAALGVARRIVRHQGAAEDVVQEAFLSLWRSGSYRPAKGSVRGFLLRIVHNAAVDLLRRERSRGAGRHVDEALAHAVAADEETHVEVERADAVRRVRDALATLPAPQQQSLALVYFDGLTHAEIALAVGVPIGTAKSRVRLGLEKLREQIDAAYCS